MKDIRLGVAIVGSSLLVALCSAPVIGGGFAIPEQGSRAMGMAGAFTAQADDPTALFHNVGGLAFFDQRRVAVGLTLVTSTDEEFRGLPPFPGAGAQGQLEGLAEPVPHFYWVQPVSDTWRFGLAVNSPFGLKTEWRDPGNFAGRFINTEASLLVVDVNPNLGYQVSEQLGLGFGVIVRFSEVEFNRRVPSFDPATGQVVDIAAARLTSDMEEGIGWQLGLLYKVRENLSWGFHYRSRVTIDYAGDGRFTQIPTGNPALDGLIAATIPFDRDLPVETGIEFPDSASIGAAVGLGAEGLLELDLDWTGWSSFDRLLITFPETPFFDEARVEDWDDTLTYRLGYRGRLGERGTGRLGVVFDPSPQPDRAVSPLLPDAERWGYAVGWGWRGDRLELDLAVEYLDFEERVNDRSIDGFNAAYSQTGWLLAATVVF